MLSGWMVDVELYAENVGLCSENVLWMDGWLVAQCENVRMLSGWMVGGLMA